MVQIREDGLPQVMAFEPPRRHRPLEECKASLRPLVLCYQQGTETNGLRAQLCADGVLRVRRQIAFVEQQVEDGLDVG
jgi:hypothetical protein